MPSKQILLVGPVTLFFLGMGLIALIDPQALLTIFDPPHFGADMRNEIRAVYGGFGIAIAALLVTTFYQAGLAEGARIAVAVALGGMAMGRVLSLIIEPAGSLWPAGAIVVELAMAAMLFASSR